MSVGGGYNGGCLGSRIKFRWRCWIFREAWGNRLVAMINLFEFASEHPERSDFRAPA